MALSSSYTLDTEVRLRVLTGQVSNVVDRCISQHFLSKKAVKCQEQKERQKEQNKFKR